MMNHLSKMPLVPLLKNTALDILSPEFLSNLKCLSHLEPKEIHCSEDKIKITNQARRAQGPKEKFEGTEEDRHSPTGFGEGGLAQGQNQPKKKPWVPREPS